MFLWCFQKESRMKGKTIYSVIIKSQGLQICWEKFVWQLIFAEAVNFNVLMSSHLQWMIYLTLYYHQNSNCCKVCAILHSGTMNPHCEIIVTYWWWSILYMIRLSSTHLTNINKKQVKSIKIALRQLYSGEHIRILLSFPQKVQNSSHSTRPSFLLPDSSKIQDLLELCIGRTLTLCFVFCAIFFITIILRVIKGK